MESQEALITEGSASLGAAMHRLVTELFPICRSITGNGVRKTLAILRRYLPLEVQEVPSGTQVLDWAIPKEWNIRDAYVKNSRGERVIDFQQHNLHVLGYSVPVQARMRLEALRPHLYSLTHQPDLIPYRTSYYQERWGFCLTQRQLEALLPGEYEVCVDSSLENGYLTYGELYLQGETEEEVLFSCHICHPSLANDNLSGIVVATYLALHLAKQDRHYSYRFLFIPGTIGSITWLAQNEANVHRVKHGLVLTCLGDRGGFTYKKTRQGEAAIDRVVAETLETSGEPFTLENFSPYGYDERQYNSPGFKLPVGTLSRSPWGRFPEYHTSGDNLNFVQPEKLQGSLELLKQVVEKLESRGEERRGREAVPFQPGARVAKHLSPPAARCYLNLFPKGEPQLGKRGLYASIGGSTDPQGFQMALLWVLNLSDGEHDLLEIAQRSGLDLALIEAAVVALLKAGLLREVVRENSDLPVDTSPR